ncbi:MAG: exosortase C-terminal domain/associated protein EpsI [bacterium]
MERSKKATIKLAVVFILLCSAFASANIGGLAKISPGVKVGLEDIPRRIGNWKMVNARDERGLFKRWEFLNEVLMRTYTRADGASIWLAISYGADQRQAFAIHLPEGCYRSAGFDVESVGTFDLFNTGVKLKRLISRGNGRTEPITYWVIIDGEVITNHLQRKIKQLYYTLFSRPSYGALVRVSSLADEHDVNRAYEIQKDFIAQLSKNLSQEKKKVFFGKMFNPSKHR